MGSLHLKDVIIFSFLSCNSLLIVFLYFFQYLSNQSTDECISRNDRDNVTPQFAHTKNVLTGRKSRYLEETEICGISGIELEGILGLSHGHQRGEKRFYSISQSSWVVYDSLPSAGPLVCSIVAFKDQFPCNSDPCYVPVYWRPSTSDRLVLRDLIEWRGYEILSSTVGSPRAILDAGANCGIASAMFAKRWPDAKIISLEPQSANYEVLQMNTKGFKNVVPLHSALWYKVGQLALFYGSKDKSSWSFAVNDVDRVPLDRQIARMEAVSIPFLLEVFNLDGFPLLKIDIEGSEREVIALRNADVSYLNRTRLALVETHDGMRKGALGNVSEAFDSLKKFRHSIHMEYHVWESFEDKGVWGF